MKAHKAFAEVEVLPGRFERPSPAFQAGACGHLSYKSMAGLLLDLSWPPTLAMREERRQKRAPSAN